MVGEQLKNILELFEAAPREDSSRACVCVHGEPGTGKTKLIDGVKNTLLISGANVFFGTGESALVEILRQLIRHFDSDGSDSDSDFMRFAASYVKGSLAEDLEQNAVKHFDKDSFVRYIYECAKAQPIVLAVDDLDKADSFMVNLLGGLLETGALRFLVFSHTDKLENELLTQMLYRNTSLIEYVQLKASESSTPRDAKSVIDATGGDSLFPVSDEAILVLSRPGMEKQLIRHYIKTAETLTKQLNFVKAASVLSRALSVFDGSFADAALEADVLLSLGDVTVSEKDIASAVMLFERAYKTADTAELAEKRAACSIRLAECCRALKLPDKACEHIMLTEAFFYKTERRTKHYDLYTRHIPIYLSFLAEQGERVIFREKLKQAYVVCLLDDLEFTAALCSEEGHFCMDTGDFDTAYKLLSDARDAASKAGNHKIWSEATNSLAICAEQTGSPDVSAALWNELIDKSYDSVKVAGALVNLAVMNFENDGDSTAARELILKGLDLYTLNGEVELADEVRENLKAFPSLMF